MLPVRTDGRILQAVAAIAYRLTPMPALERGRSPNYRSAA
jgi:hypothetical protein